jgi:hypothetical protein
MIEAAPFVNDQKDCAACSPPNGYGYLPPRPAFLSFTKKDLLHKEDVAASCAKIR